jgi:hypothetical protein
MFPYCCSMSNQIPPKLVSQRNTSQSCFRITLKAALSR